MKKILLSFLVLSLFTACSQEVEVVVEEEVIVPVEQENLIDDIVMVGEKEVLDEIEKTSSDMLEIEVTAENWEFTPAEIRVKKGDRVRLKVRSIDVEHGLKIPRLNIQEVLLPGELVDIEFVAEGVGEFPFSCSVYCGEGHGGMEGVIIVEETEEEAYLLEFDETELDDAEAEFLASGRAKAVENVTQLWQFYEHEGAGFWLNYPYSVTMGDDFNVEVTLIENLEDTMGFDMETAQLNEVNLAEGKYGEDVDFPIGVSKKIRRVGDYNAQDFVVMGRFEICDLRFERKLYFFANGYQIVMTLSIPRDVLTASSPDYFTTNPENCQDDLIWDFDKQDEFYNVLAEGKGAELIQEKFDLFNQIVETIHFDVAG